MEFRAPSVAKTQNSAATEYLTKSLSDQKKGIEVLTEVFQTLGNAVYSFPDWHPILTIPQKTAFYHMGNISQISLYNGIDHTQEFVRGFVTCPYSEETANQLVKRMNQISGLNVYRLESALYADNAFPVVVEAYEVELEADGTIRSKDALRWFVQQAMSEAKTAQVAETWWNVRSLILGSPHGSRSSLFVNQFTGVHMRKILEALNNSGLFGPIKESSLAMLSKKKRNGICEKLIHTAVTNWDKQGESFNFELCGETCNATVKDTWEDGAELSVRVEIGSFDLFVRGFYYTKDGNMTYSDPTGKRALAEKFV